MDADKVRAWNCFADIATDPFCRYEDVKIAASDSETFISSKCAIVPSDPRGIRRPPLKFDGKEHTPYRTAIDRTVKPSRIKRLELILEQHAETLFNDLLSRGEGDICNDFGAEFSGLIEKEWLNLSEESAKMLTDNVRPFVQSWRTGDWEAVKRASDAFYAIARDVLADRRVNPRDPEEDPASSLLLEKDAEGKPLDEFNLVYVDSLSIAAGRNYTDLSSGAVRQALIVAMVAPSILQGAIAVHLAKDKALQNKLRDDPSLISSAVEEFVRLYTPYRGFARTATKDVTFSDQLIPADEPITLTYAAANRDPEQFPNPAEFELDRENIKQHVGFGRGKHRCAGMPLARMALKVFLTTLLKRTKDFEVCGELDYA